MTSRILPAKTLARIGAASFTFFLVKGLAWLALAWWAARGLGV